MPLLLRLMIAGVVVGIVGALAMTASELITPKHEGRALDYFFGALMLIGGGVLAYISWLTWMAGSAWVLVRTRPGTALRDAAIWFLIGLVICVGYVLRDDLALLGRRIVAELLPHRGVERGGTVQFKAQERGHFVVEAQVSGVPVRFLLDTGATDVVLAPADARRLGLDTAALAYTRSYQTANGTVRGAPVRLDRVEVGPIQLRNVTASVNAAAMDRSLLGMSFLSRLSGFDVTGETLTLRP